MGRTLILAGDVGGTKTYLALFDAASAAFAPLEERRYTTRDFEDLGALLAAFVDETGQAPARVVLGVPGPVRQLPVRAVNLPWLIDPAALQQRLGIDQVHLLNDLQATAYGTRVLAEEDLFVLNPGQADPQGTVAVIAAGTGLGEGGLCWTGERYLSIASEGGHASFAPGDELEAELWVYLNRKFDHVSWERVVSGPGLVSVYEFLRDSGRHSEPEWLRAELEKGDGAGAISRAAQEDRCALAGAALDLFVHLYGCEAGNLALKFMSTGGLYVGGGIAPKILEKLRRGRFMEGFLDKGRMRQALSEVPVRVILKDRTALLGAAYWGAQL